MGEVDASSAATSALPSTAPIDFETAETLAAHLFTHAAAVRDRHAQLEADIVSEEAATTAVRGETAALQAELEQYEGWLSGELEGGAAYRMSKELHDEHEKRTSAEAEVTALRTKLATMSTHLQALVQQSRNLPQTQQARAADDALAHLALLRDVYRSGSTSSGAAASSGVACQQGQGSSRSEGRGDRTLGTAADVTGQSVGGGSYS